MGDLSFHYVTIKTVVQVRKFSGIMEEKTHPSTCCSNPLDLFKGCFVVPIRTVKVCQRLRSSATGYDLLINIIDHLIITKKKSTHLTINLEFSFNVTALNLTTR
jgi:hypothetical protein